MDLEKRLFPCSSQVDVRRLTLIPVTINSNDTSSGPPSRIPCKSAVDRQHRHTGVSSSSLEEIFSLLTELKRLRRSNPPHVQTAGGREMSGIQMSRAVNKGMNLIYFAGAFVTNQSILVVIQLRFQKSYSPASLIAVK